MLRHHVMTDVTPEGAAAPGRSWTSWWPVLPGLAVGAYLGFQGGYITSQGGMAALAAIFFLFLLAGLIGLLGVIGVILLASRASRTGGRGLLLAAAGVLVGGVAGWAAVPALGLGYRAPLTLHAAGTADLVLEAEPAYSAIEDGLVECHSVADSLEVESVWGLDLGELGAGTLRAMVDRPIGGSTGRVELFIDGADVGEGGRQPSWSGSGSFEGDGDWATGTVRFADLPVTFADGPGTPSDDWPAELTGSLTWSCDPWTPAGEMPPLISGGELQLTLPGEDLQITPGTVTCQRQESGLLFSLTANEVYRLQDWPIGVTIGLERGVRVGGEVLVLVEMAGKDPPPGQQFKPNWGGYAIVTAADADGLGGTAELDQLPTGVDPAIGAPPAGWPETLTGTVTWRCE